MTEQHPIEPSESGAAEKKKRPRWQIVVGAVAGVFVLLVVIGAVFGDKKDEPQAVASKTAVATTSSAAPTTTAATTTTTVSEAPSTTTTVEQPKGDAMPDLVGTNLKDAQSRAQDLGLTVETVDATGKGRTVFQPDNWVVSGQSIQAGGAVERSQSLTLDVHKKGEKSGGGGNTSSKVDKAAYNESIKQSILGGAGLTSFGEACTQGIEWICYIADVDSSTTSIVKVTVQITDKDKAFGSRVARGVYNFASGDHPDIEWVQVNNARGDVIANDSFK